ncbi:hypothetical protein [Streptomyces sp. NPDC059943]|uniref:hypothetical protein n=1 Tax=Streptomyces sp. NPDC059943 TaxID=3347010 RepID=UPI003669B4AB
MKFVSDIERWAQDNASDVLELQMPAPTPGLIACIATATVPITAHTAECDCTPGSHLCDICSSALFDDKFFEDADVRPVRGQSFEATLSNHPALS